MSTPLGRSARTTLFTDEKYLFCGSPYIYVYAWDIPVPFDKKKSMEVGISVHDEDDFDVGVIYECESKDEQQIVFNELINFTHDIKNSIVPTYKIVNASLFPDLGIKTHWW